MAAPTLNYVLSGNVTEAESLIANILDCSTEYSIIGTDLDGNILLWNEGARRIYGYAPEELVGRENQSMLHVPEEVQARKPQEMMESCLRDGKWEGVVGRVRKNGDRFSARVVITPRRAAAGRPIGFLLISKDISDEIRLTEELKATRFYTRTLVEANIDMLVTTDPLGYITDANRQMEALTGYTRAELIGSPFERYFTAPQRAEEAIHLALCNGMVTDYELTVLAKDGKETVVSYNMANFFDREGRLQGVFAAARDVTERKQFEEALQAKNLELERASLAKDRFLASMSHELRTPLNAILGFAGTLLMKLPGPLNEDQQRQLNIIKSSARHLLSLINDLLDMARIESGRVDLHFEAVDCNGVMQEVATALRPLAEGKGLGFDVHLPTSELLAHTNRRSLHQILLNLTNNAIKFTERGSIRLTAARTQRDGQEQIEFQVADTGVGIRPEDRQHLFKAFTQLNQGRGQVTEGTGLGLHISQMLAELLGGHIQCESDYGKGSVFTLVLKDIADPGGH